MAGHADATVRDPGLLVETVENTDSTMEVGSGPENWSVEMETPLGTLPGMVSLGNGSIYLSQEHTPGDRADNGGVNIEVGDDYVGIMLRQVGTDEMQMHPDYGDYFVTLQDGFDPGTPSTKGWRAADDDGNPTGLLSKAPWRSLAAAPSLARRGRVLLRHGDAQAARLGRVSLAGRLEAAAMAGRLQNALLLRLGVGVVPGSRRIFDLGGVGTGESVRVFDIEAPPASGESIRTFDVIGAISGESSRVFDVHGPLRGVSTRTFDVIGDSAEVPVGSAPDPDSPFATTLAADADAGDTVITVTSAAGIQVGELLNLGGEYRAIVSVVGTTVTLSDPLGS